MLYLWSCNQSVAWKCRHWNMLRPKIYWTKSQRNLAKFQNFEKFNIIQICTDVTVLLHSIWELLSNTLRSHLTTCISSSFFHFLPISSGRNWKKHLFSSFFHSSGKKPISSGSFQTLYWSMQQPFVWPTGLTHSKTPENTKLCPQACNSHMFSWPYHPCTSKIALAASKIPYHVQNFDSYVQMYSWIGTTILTRTHTGI